MKWEKLNTDWKIWRSKVFFALATSSRIRNKAPFNGVIFFTKRLKIPLQYCLTVADKNIRIASTVMDGYNGDATPEKPNAPKVARCDSNAVRP